jgi:CheY-like chemotaxis protein
LLVDDDPDVLDAFGAYLEAAGFTVVLTTNATDAIKVATRVHPDVIVLDFALPGRDGYAVVDALQADTATASIPVVLFSGWLPEPTEPIPHVHAFVAKPGDPQQILSLVQLLAGGNGAEVLH